jgi:LPXTG-motif cell wall-anchored protein
LCILALAFATLTVSSSPAVALAPRIAVCGRVTAFTPAQPPDSPIVRLGTQEPRRLVIGSASLPQVGQELCIWGVDVENVNPPAPDPAPSGIAEWQIAPVSSIGCADAVTTTTALFTMPGENVSPLPNRATLALPLRAPAAGACVRIAVDATGNPVAVLLPAVAGASPTPTPRANVDSLPSTSAGDDSGVPALAMIGAVFAAIALIVRRRRHRAIPS